MIEYGTLKNFAENLEKYIYGEPTTYIVLCDKTEVNYGREEDCDVDWCKDNNIPCYNIQRASGCCVSADGSILIADIRHGSDPWITGPIMYDFVKWLQEKGLNATYDNNDVLIDGYKVASAGAYNLPPDWKIKYSGFQFSITQDIYVIEHACKNQSLKPPKGLAEYGITTDEVLCWVIKYFETQ